jgi:hypothetical protein
MVPAIFLAEGLVTFFLRLRISALNHSYSILEIKTTIPISLWLILTQSFIIFSILFPNFSLLIWYLLLLSCSYLSCGINLSQMWDKTAYITFAMDTTFHKFLSMWDSYSTKLQFIFQLIWWDSKFGFENWSNSNNCFWFRSFYCGILVLSGIFKRMGFLISLYFGTILELQIKFILKSV